MLTFSISLYIITVVYILVCIMRLMVKWCVLRYSFVVAASNQECHRSFTSNSSQFHPQKWEHHGVNNRVPTDGLRVLHFPSHFSQMFLGQLPPGSTRSALWRLCCGLASAGGVVPRCAQWCQVFTMNFKAPTIAWLEIGGQVLYWKILRGFKPSIRKHPSPWFWHPSRPFLGDQDQTPLFLSAGMISRNFHKGHRNVPGASGQTVTFLDYPPDWLRFFLPHKPAYFYRNVVGFSQRKRFQWDHPAVNV